MKKLTLLVIAVLAATSLAVAQVGPSQTTEILGAHNGYGRGCVMCHTPHSGSLGNGAGTLAGGFASGDPQNGMVALWGQNVSLLYGKTFNFGGGTYPVTLPSSYLSTGTGNNNGLGGPGGHGFYAETIVIFCLSCHDGVTATVGMMRGQTVETLPVVGGNAPTLLATVAPSGGTAYENDHPVGGSAVVSCNGSSTSVPAPTTSSESGYNWDCTGGGKSTVGITPGPNMIKFLGQYPASIWLPTNATTGAYPNPLSTSAVTGYVNCVTCTTCHNQHSMTAYSNGTTSGTTPTTNYWTTMFFVKGYYNPVAGSNSVAQFCRNCHGGNANEMNGVYSVPTT